MYNLPTDVLDGFNRYLKNTSVSPSTLRYYRSDAKHFLNWSDNSQEKINQGTVRKYIENLRENKTPISTINRKLSTLRKLSEFMQANRIVSTDFMGGVGNISGEGRKDKMEEVIGSEETRFSRNLTIVGSMLFGISIILNNNSLDLPFGDGIVTQIEADTSVSEEIEVTQTSIPDEIEEAQELMVITGEEGEYRIIENGTTSSLMLKEGPNGKVEMVSNTDAYGSGTIVAEENSALIRDSRVDEDSYVFVTATTDPNGQILYVSGQSEGYFVVSIGETTDRDIGFNWWAK